MPIFSSRRSPREAAAKRRQMDKNIPDWREKKHENGAPVYDSDGTMLDSKGNRSIFDDVDE